MTWPANAPSQRAWRFVLELEPGSDALLRVLDPFRTQGARVVTLVLADDRLEVTATELDELRASRLQAKLQQLGLVRSIAAGWHDR